MHMHVTAGDKLIVAIYVQGEGMFVEEMTCNGFRSYGISLTDKNNMTRIIPFHAAADWYACGYQSDGYAILVKDRHQLDAAVAAECQRQAKYLAEEDKERRRKQIQDKIDALQKELDSIV